MDFLKRLFGGGGTQPAGSDGDRSGMYFYVRPFGCEEVVRVRIDRNNDLSWTDDESALWVHKSVRGVKCRQGVEMTLYFDRGRALQHSELQGGELVKQEDYDAWKATQTQEA